METPLLSVVIPVLNEAAHLPALLQSLRQPGVEVVVCDGGSTDESVHLAKATGATVVHCPLAHRAMQLNMGAAVARATRLWFLHADVSLPTGAIGLVMRSFDEGKTFGCFRFRFDKPGAMLALNAWCTRLPLMICRGGDQTLFCTRALFETLGGYNESMVVMEDYDFIRRGRRVERFWILPSAVVVSARKYEHNSYLRVNVANLLIFTGYYAGVKPATLKRCYTKLIRHPKWIAS